MSGARTLMAEDDPRLLGGVTAKAAELLARRDADDALEPGDRELADFFDSAPVALYWLGPDGTILRANQAAAALLGYSADEYVGQPITAFPADREVSDDMLDRLRLGEELHGYEGRLRGKDGSIKYVLIDANGKWQDGRLVHCRCFARDVTDQKRAELMTRFLVEPGADYTCVARFDGRELTLESASEGFTRVTGYSIDEFDVQTATFAVHPDDLLAVVQNFERLLRGESVGGESRIVTKSGDLRSLRYLAEPTLERGDPPIVRIRGTAQDITDRQQASARAQEAERQFRQLADNINEVFWIADQARTQIFYCSPAYTAIWGRPPPSARAESVHWLDTVIPDDRLRFVAALEAAARGESADVEYRITRPDGAERWVRDRSFPIKEQTGEVYRVVGVAEDFTERATVALENARLLTTLQESDQRKDAFLAMLAHELRNPLAPIRNAVHILRAKGPPIPELTWAREVIERQVQQMTRLVDDLLDVSRISRGKIELRKTLVPLAEIVQIAVEASRPHIDQWNHQLTVAIPPEPLYLDADPLRLAQALANLLNNAAKYTDVGGRIELTGAQLEGAVEIRVKDTGIGIPVHMLSQIFEMFAQIDSSRERAQGGLGIGLTLVRQLVEMHGGSVTAHSDGPGRGSEFIVRLPLAAGTMAGQTHGVPDSTAPQPVRRRILVVDDNRDAADSLALLLSILGNEVHTAYDGVEALGAAAVLQPDVVLLDLGMPKLNGCEAGRRIRQELGADVVLIALTGWGQADDRRRTADAGFDHHLVKPVDPAALEKLLAQRRAAPAPASPT